jgi:pimeloyl-ACP methyl ester carboxylesterase
MKIILSHIFAAVIWVCAVEAFVPGKSQLLSAKSSLSAIPTSAVAFLDKTFTPPDVAGQGGITEKACEDAAIRMNRIRVPVPEYVSSTREVGISFIHWEAEKKTNTLTIILVHGFDSSCLEYRRLGPKLAALGVDTYAVDLLGWGFSQLKSVNTFSAQAKVDALAGFWKVVGDGKPVQAPLEALQRVTHLI